MKKLFTIAGAITGLLLGGGIMVLAFMKAPGTPGMFELLFQAAIVGVIVVVGAVVGLLTGCLIGLFVRKK